MKRILTALLALACGACATMPPAAPSTTSTTQQPAATVVGVEGHNVKWVELPPSVPQGGLLMGRVQPGSALIYEGRGVRIASDGRFVIGIAREQTGVVTLKFVIPHVVAPSLGVVPSTFELSASVPIVPRTFPVERVNGVPEKTVNPPPDIAARIMREQAEVDGARMRDDDRTDFDTKFIWPVKGRISGVFGSQRIYNGTPASAHSGVDVAAAKGTPIHAPAGGIVTFANPDLYLTGGTVLIDHGHGVSSNFLHLSRIDVKVGDRIEQGQVIGLVGATGRATGPHMHWGMNWFNVRVDPQSLMPPGDAK